MFEEKIAMCHSAINPFLSQPKVPLDKLEMFIIIIIIHKATVSEKVFVRVNCG